MTLEQIQKAAEFAILAMSDADKRAFIDMFEGNSDQAVNVSRAFAVEGIQRQITMGHMALEKSNVMRDLTEVVYEEMAGA